jgi:RimJ/RimL family protein N-acetyltransferase
VIRATIEFARGRLRPLHPDDAELIHKACSDLSIGRWTQIPQPYHLEDAREFIGSKAGEDHAWAIDADGFSGVIGVRNTMATMPGPVTEVGYWVASWARGKGLATEALIALRDELARVGYQRINWEALAGNEASIRVAQKAGFIIEGYRRQGMVQRGRLVDCVVGGWTAQAEVPELVAGAWQVQPVSVSEVPATLRPLASNAVATWVARTAVGGVDSGFVLAVRSVAGLHVIVHQAPQAAADAARRYLVSQGWALTDQPLPPGWM